MYTSLYAVGKFTVTIKQSDGAAPSENWIACPFDLLDQAGSTLASKTFDEMLLDMCVSNETVVGNRDTVYSQNGIGGATISARRGNGVWANIVGGTPATNFYARQGYMVTVPPAHQGPDKAMIFVGRVPTNTVLVGAVQKSNGVSPIENWVAYPYPVGNITFDQGNVGSVLSNETVVGNRDTVFSQAGVGGATISARRGNGVWANIVGGTRATNLYGGQHYRMTIPTAHTGAATNWYVPKPY